jgi:Flp pilus assembly protein TadD
MLTPLRRPRVLFRSVVHGAAVAVLWTTVSAMSSVQPLLVAYRSELGGSALGQGAYDEAVRILAEAQPPRTSAAALATNRCVAFTVTRMVEAARMACAMAVEQAQQDHHWLSQWGARHDPRYDIAQAYSNRAVFEWLAGDTAAAQRDLQSARALAPAAAFVASNFAALQGAPAGSAVRLALSLH